MIIYRNGTEILEVKDFKVTGKFMEVAVLDCTIKSAYPIDFKIGDYVIYDYNGLIYTLYDVPAPKKQARKGTYGEAFIYDLKFKSDMEQLAICPFLDLVANDNELHYTSLPSFSTFENVYGIALRLQANMDYLYPRKWRIVVAQTDDADLQDTLNEAKDFGVSGESCLDGLKKIYSTWGVGYIHTVEDGVNIITIGKSAGTTSLFRYGKGQGLRTIKKSVQNSDQFCTRVYAYGSSRNIPAKWYNEKGYIGEAQYAPYLMIPPSKWVDGIPQGAYIDAIFNGENRVEKYGLRIKTFSYDGSNGRNEIFPSIEKVTAGEIRKAKAELSESKYIPSESYSDVERMDYILEGSNVEDDGVSIDSGYQLYSEKITVLSPEINKSEIIAEAVGKSNYKPLSFQRNITVCSFDITNPATYRVSEILDMVTLSKDELESTIGAKWYIQTPDGSYLDLLKSVVFTDKFSATLQLPEVTFLAEKEGRYTLTLRISVGWNIENVQTTVADDLKLNYFILGSDVTISRGEKILQGFFNIKLKQIGFDLNTVTAADGSAKTISFKSGMCSGRSFVITKCEYSPVDDSWALRCRRAVDSSISQTFPNNTFQIAAGDQFILLNINMPDLYVHTAMQRLYDAALADLKHYSNPQFVVSPEIDNLQMARSPQVIKEGMYMPIEDEDINIDDEILIDGVTITEKDKELRRFDVTLRNDKIYNRFSKIANSLSNLESSIEEAKKASNNIPMASTDKTVILEGSSDAMDFGLALVEEDGKTWLRSKYDFFSEGEVSSGGPSGSNPDEPSGSIVSVEQILTEGTPIANVIVDGMDNIIYAPKAEDIDLSAYATIDYVDTAIQNAEDTRVDELIDTTIPALESDIAKRALQTTLDTHISNYNSFATSTTTTLTAHDKRIKSFEDIIGIDENGDVYIKKNGDVARNFYSYGEISSGGLSDTESEVSGDYLPLSGGTIEGTSASPFGVNSTDATQTYITIRNGGAGKAAFGYHTSYGAFMYNFPSVSYLGVKDNGTPIYVNGGIERELIHSGNIGQYITGGGTAYLPLSGGTISSEDYDALEVKRTRVGNYSASIKFSNAGDGKLGSFGVWGSGNGAKGVPFFEDGVNEYTLIHSGNIGSYITGGGTACLPLSGGTLSSSGFSIFKINRTDINGGVAVGFSNSLDGHLGYLGIGGSASQAGINPIYQDSSGNVYKIIHSGGGTINGTLVVQTTSNGGVQLSQNAINGYSNGNYENLHLNIANSKNVSICSGGGNVLIGTTTNSGAKLYVAGNIVATGDMTSGSDERYKRIESYAEIDIETIANAPIINFRWTDRKDNKLHLGSTAQYWYNTSLCNGVIPTNDEKLWTMGYGQIALAGLVSVAKKVVNHEERLQIVEKELADYKAENQILKQQLNEYRRA